MKSKRFLLALIALAANSFVFYSAIEYGSDLIALGTGLALVNTPVFGYLTAETIRPSGITHEGETIKPKV